MMTSKLWMTRKVKSMFLLTTKPMGFYKIYKDTRENISVNFWHQTVQILTSLNNEVWWLLRETQRTKSGFKNEIWGCAKRRPSTVSKDSSLHCLKLPFDQANERQVSDAASDKKIQLELCQRKHCRDPLTVFHIWMHICSSSMVGFEERWRDRNFGGKQMIKQDDHLTLQSLIRPVRSHLTCAITQGAMTNRLRVHSTNSAKKRRNSLLPSPFGRC